MGRIFFWENVLYRLQSSTKLHPRVFGCMLYGFSQPQTSTYVLFYLTSFCRFQQHCDYRIFALEGAVGKQIIYSKHWRSNVLGFFCPQITMNTGLQCGSLTVSSTKSFWLNFTWYCLEFVFQICHNLCFPVWLSCPVYQLQQEAPHPRRLTCTIEVRAHILIFRWQPLYYSSIFSSLKKKCFLCLLIQYNKMQKTIQKNWCEIPAGLLVCCWSQSLRRKKPDVFVRE